MEIVLVERREDLSSRGATFGLARNGQLSLQEIAPPAVLEALKAMGIHIPSTGGYMLPWWKVRETLLETVQGTSPYRDMIHIYLGCVVDKVENMDKEEQPLRVSFVATTATTTTTTTSSSSNCTVPETQEFDVLIGADGVHSQIRTQVLNLAPAIATDTVVWRGSVDTNVVTQLQHCQEFPPGKLYAFRPDMVMAFFNFHARFPGIVAWVFSFQNASQRTIVPGTTTPLEILQDYRANLSAEQEAEEAVNLNDAMAAMENTIHPSDLTWSTEMAVVDLDAFSENRWGGQGRVTIIGDAAHSIRPATGLGGSLAFEDAALLTRILMDDSNNATIPERLAHFEAQRLPRCRSISRDQTLRSTLAYKIGFMNVPVWDPAYSEWISQGPNASPYPPVDERQVFEAVLREIEIQVESKE